MSKRKILTVVLTLLVAVCLLATSALAVAPTTPTDPTAPTTPTNPTTPTDPTVPTEPTQPTQPTQPTEPTGPKFVDVNEGDWFYDSVIWAVKNGVTDGTNNGTTFEPYKGCTRAEMIEFLWKAAGKPAATLKAVNFVDVPASGSEDFWYEEALLWGVENGIVFGTNDGSTFSPDKECTRAEMVSFVVRHVGNNGGELKNAPFTDLDASAWYYQEVVLAWNCGLTVGTNDGTTFSPDKVCTRAEAVEFLYNAFAK